MYVLKAKIYDDWKMCVVLFFCHSIWCLCATSIADSYIRVRGRDKIAQINTFVTLEVFSYSASTRVKFLMFAFSLQIIVRLVIFTSLSSNVITVYLHIAFAVSVSSLFSLIQSSLWSSFPLPTYKYIIQQHRRRSSSQRTHRIRKKIVK